MKQDCVDKQGRLAFLQTTSREAWYSRRCMFLLPFSGSSNLTALSRLYSP